MLLLGSLYGRHSSKHLKFIGSQKPGKVGLLVSFLFTMRKMRCKGATVLPS